MYLSEHIIIHAYKKIHSTQTNTQMLAYTAMTELVDGILDGARLLADSLNDSMGVPCCRDENITQWTVSQSLHNGQSVQVPLHAPLAIVKLLYPLHYAALSAAALQEQDIKTLFEIYIVTPIQTLQVIQWCQECIRTGG